MYFIKTDSAIAALRRIGGDLSYQELQLAQVRAINHTLGKARTLARKEIKRVYNISQRYLGGVDFQRASSVTLTGKLVASRKPIPLDAFAPKQETASGNTSISKKGVQKTRQFKRAKANPLAGVSIMIKRGEREVIPYAFMIAGGAIRVFARGEYKSGTQHGFVLRNHRVNSDGNDTPVKPLITVSEFGSILNPVVIGRIGSKVREMYPDRLEHELVYLIENAKTDAEGAR